MRMQSSLYFSPLLQPSSSSFFLPDSQLPNTPLPSSPEPHEKPPSEAPTVRASPLQHLPPNKRENPLLGYYGRRLGKAFSQKPSLHSVSLHSSNSVVSFLRSKGIHNKDLAKIFGMWPKILTSDISSDLIPVFNFLSDDLKVPDRNLHKVINKNPRLLASWARDQLKPALFERLGFKDVEALAYHDSILLVSNVEKTLVPKLKFLESLGISKEEAIGMVLRWPALFTFSVEKNFRPKFDYFAREMKRRVEELKEFPQYFAFSLEKRIKPRHLEVVGRGMEMALPSMLKTTDEEFRELISHGSG